METISVVIPTYNEEGNIESLYNKITKQLENIKYEIILVNDGSTDKSKEILN